MFNSLFKPRVSMSQDAYSRLIATHQSECTNILERANAQVKRVETARDEALAEYDKATTRALKAESERDWARTQCDDAVKERDEAIAKLSESTQELSAAFDQAVEHMQHADYLRAHAEGLLERALVLLSEVKFDTRHPKGKQHAEAIAQLQAEAKEQGL